MARLQILELPEVVVGSVSETPFILVVDQCVPQRVALGATAAFGDYWQDLADRIGARGVIVTPETVDIPANDTSGYLAPPAKQELVVELNGDPVTAKPRRDWCCSLAFQTLGKQHIDDCRQGNPQP
ncbi:hypothetical protein [Streptomyces sp. E5N298]|uniref:hypothetical protein n=1 Tax=Streptomyces sp. E5N298 TaxID=1851983 RepID=UPI000EF5CAD7|nr:hypothetical protein [Streptomyces sp. E5N298]